MKAKRIVLLVSWALVWCAPILLAQEEGDGFRIQWYDHTIITNQPPPELAPSLSMAAFPSGEPGYYFVQLTGPVTRAMKAQVTEAGGELLDYVPNNSFLVRMDAEARARVEALPVVQWVGLFQPAYRLSTSLAAAMPEAPVYDEFRAPPDLSAGMPDVQLTVLAFRGADLERLEADVAAAGGEVLDSAEGKYDSKLAVTLPPDRLSDLARLGGVKWIERRTLNKLHNNTGRGVMNVAPVWTGPDNLRGNGQIVAVSDTGLDSGVNNATMHDDVEGRIVAINSWAVQPYTGVLNVGADDAASDLDSGHGTHVAGSVLGNGTASGSTFAGTAPQASVVFQALEQWTNYPGTADDDFLLTGIPLDLNNLFQQAYDAGARIHTSSWGGGVPGAYDGQSQDVDEFVWDNPDMLILYSAGNDGAEGADADNVVDLGSVTSPGTCKSCITVGASENNRPAIPQTWAARFGALIDADQIADATNGMAAFSSRGPAQNNRIKPDLVAPGTMVASIRTQASPNAVRFTDDMESGVGGWATTGAWAQTAADAQSGTTSWHDSPAGNYAANANGRLTSPAINLSTGGNQRESLQFWARWDFPDPGDQWFLEVSNNGGTTWGGIPGISGTQPNWELFSIGLGPFANSANFQVRFRLAVDGDAVRGDGLYVDDVRVVEGAFGSSLLSDQGLAAAGSANDQNYLLFNGTSMATPLTAGAAALVRQYYTDVEKLGYVSAALLRATLINGATDMDPGQYGNAANNREMGAKPNNVEGWGRVNVANSLYPPGAAVLDWIDELGGLETAESRAYTLSVTDATVPIVVTMVYHDFPGAAIVNQLDLTVTRGGTTSFPNGLAAADLNNNVEQIVIPAAQVTTGDYTITVNAPNVPQGPQPYALATSAGGTLGVRSPVDIMLVLDISGSMLSAACPGCDPKLDVLKDAVEIFIQLWTALAVPNDRLGVTYFRTNINEFASGGNVLLPVLANAPAMITDVQGQTTTLFDLTAMGGGLQSAINRLTDAARPRSIVLFTDGQQNVNPTVVEVDDSPPAGAFHLEIANDPGTSTSSNVSPTVPPTRLDTALDRKVNTIAVGASASWVSLLQKIANKTGGQHKETTAPDNDLRRFYVEELVDALRGFSPQLIGYRKGQLSGGSASEAFAVNASAEKLVLKLSWTAGDEMSFTVKKGGQDVTSAGRIIAGPFYRIWSVGLPAQFKGGTIDAAGDWVMEITSGVAGQGAGAYEAAAIADEKVLEYEFSAGEAVYEVGEPLRFSVSVSADETPVTDATVTARVLKPGASIGTLLSTTATPSFGGIQAEPSATGAEKKLQLLLQDGTFWNTLQAVQPTAVTLASNGDGTYSGTFGGTDLAGSYRVVFEVEGTHPEIGDYERTEERSTLVEFGAAELRASAVRLYWPEDPSDGDPIALFLRPQDRFGNILGPGYGNQIRVSVSSGVAGRPQDQLDGSYKIPLSGVDEDTVITVTVMRRPLLEEKLGARRGYRYALSFHLGYTDPTGTFGKVFSGDRLIEVDFEYPLSSRFSLNGVLGSYSFDPSYDVLGGTLYLRRYWPQPAYRLFAEAGPGLYDPDFLSLSFGASAGVGVDRALAPSWRGELGLGYFHIFNSGTDIEYFVAKVGLRRTF